MGIGALFASGGTAVLLALGGAAIGLGASAYSFDQANDLYEVSRADIGAKEKLSYQSYEDARFNYIMGWVNLFLGTLDVGLALGSGAKLIKGAAATKKLLTQGGSEALARMSTSQVKRFSKAHQLLQKGNTTEANKILSKLRGELGDEVFDSANAFFKGGEKASSTQKINKQLIKKTFVDQTKQTFKKFTTKADAEKWAHEAFEEWYKSLTKAEIEAIYEYSGSAYYNINAVLRGHADNFIGNNKKYVELISKAISRSGVPENIVVYRGASKEILGPLKNVKADDLIGATVQEKGFMSTSLIKDRAFGGDLFLEINVSKGSKGVFIGKISQFEEEIELLLNKGQKLLVLEAKTQGHTLHLVCELLN